MLALVRPPGSSSTARSGRARTGTPSSTSSRGVAMVIARVSTSRPGNGQTRTAAAAPRPATLPGVERARVVVIGGGIAGCSVAFHLARAGWDGVVLVEKGELTSGSTHHAAGLVTQFNPSSTMMAFRRYSVELYRELGVFEGVGSVRVASSRDSLLELRRAASRAAALGLEARLLSPDEVVGK